MCGSRKTKPVKRTGKAAGILVLFALMLCLMTGCARQGQKEVTSLDQLSEPGIRIGVPGTIIEFDMLKRDYPGAEVIPYSDNPLGYQDVASGRIDVYIYERREMSLAIEHGTEGVRLLEGA
jgi:ABC-type amino acid transport substrate-binding protein